MDEWLSQRNENWGIPVRGFRRYEQPADTFSMLVWCAPVIRPVEERDAATWGEMRRRLWPHADGDELLRETDVYVRGGDSFIGAAFIAEDGAGEPLGFIELSIRDFANGCDSMPIAFVEGWYVEPSARRKGLGRALMGAAEAWAAEGGYSELASDTEVANVGSQDAHAALGFAETERLVTFRKALTG